MPELGHAHVPANPNPSHSPLNLALELTQYAICTRVDRNDWNWDKMICNL